MSDLAVKLLAELSRESAPGRYVVALSGGLDSTVLLHALASLRDADSLHAELAAVHINHQLSDMAMEWQAFCAEICQQWQVPLTTREVVVSADGSLEAAARAARYDAFCDLVKSGDSLLLAHHLDDQIETSLYRLLRGAGPQGLSGIPRMRGLGDATLWRPLLEFTRADLRSYALAKGLQWKEDESNQDDRHDRNFLRHHIFPVLEGRWPDYRASWLKSLNLMVESNALQRDLADQDLVSLLSPRGGLLMVHLEQLNPARQRNVIRRWAKRLGLQALGWRITHQLVDEFLSASESGPSFDITDCLLYRHDGELFAVRKGVSDAPDPITFTASDRSVEMRPGNGALLLSSLSGNGISKRLQHFAVRYRIGGETLKLPGRPTKSLKDLLHESGVPPWQRQRVPLIYAEAELVCVPGIGVAESHQAEPGDSGLHIQWQAPTQVITLERPLESGAE